VLKLEVLLGGDVYFRSINEMKLLLPFLTTRAHSWLYGASSKLEMLLRGDVNFHSTNEVEVLIVTSFETQEVISCCTVADARVV
jgi:hypothetical protein